jgi:hypothetical protein
MLSKEVLKAQMNRLTIAYPDWAVRAKLDKKETMELWYEMLENYDDYELVDGVKAYIKNNKYGPTIAALIDEVKEVDPYKGLKRKRYED